MEIRIDVNFRPSLAQCPECGNIQDFVGGTAATCICRKCNYHVGGDFSYQWIAFCQNEIPQPPAGAIITFAHEGEPNDFYFDVEVAESVVTGTVETGEATPDRIAFFDWVKAIGGRQKA